MPYDAANKPAFTAPGAYTVEYRSTDAAGNVEATKTVAFSIAAPTGDDTLAPVTTGTLDPAQPGPGKTYSGPVTVNLSALDPAPAGAKNVDVDAAGTQWSPTTRAASARATASRGASAPSAGAPHDVWVVPPGGNPSPSGPDLDEVTDDRVPGRRAGVADAHPDRHVDVPVPAARGVHRRRLERHGRHRRGRRGRPAVGVDFTEYRVNGGDWVRNANTGGAARSRRVTVSAEGQHTVEYRSADEAGNVEATKSVAFGIDLPDAGLPGDRGVRRPGLGRGAAARCASRRPASTPTAARCRTGGSSPTARCSADRVARRTPSPARTRRR